MSKPYNCWDMKESGAKEERVGQIEKEIEKLKAKLSAIMEPNGGLLPSMKSARRKRRIQEEPNPQMAFAE